VLQALLAAVPFWWQAFAAVGVPEQWEQVCVPVQVSTASHAQPPTVHVAFVVKPLQAAVVGEVTVVFRGPAVSATHVAADVSFFAEKAQPDGQFTLGHACAPWQACVPAFHTQPFLLHVALVRAAQLAVVGPWLSASATAKVQPFACAQVAAVHAAAVHVPAGSRARQAS
jgi:hypothetical protein